MKDKVYSASGRVTANRAKTAFWIIFLIVATILLFGYVGAFFGFFAFGIIAGIITAAVIIPLELVKAKKSILSLTNARKANSRIAKEAQLTVMVEGLSSVAGLPKTPEIYVLPTAAPNAFASGLSPKSAFIGVTQGLLDQMGPNELEGVLAHEITHIRHRDILITQLIAAVSATLILLTFYAPLAVIKVSSEEDARRRANGEKEKGGGLDLLAMIFLLIAAPIAKLVSFLIEMSVSRKREYAADAGAAILCGNSFGIANALEKIKNYDLRAGDAEAFGGNRFRSMYIHFPAKSALFSTHPPIEKRIRILRNMC
jgi:heat shock protein HtpX